MNLQEILFALSEASGMGGLSGALDIAEREFSRYARVTTIGSGSLLAELPGENDYRILLDAHIDEIGMMVTSVDDDGFVRVAAAGGIDVRTLAAQPVTVWGTEPVPGVFCSTPPHLKKSSEDTVPELSELAVDTGLPGGRAKKLVAPGSRVTFSQNPAALQNGLVTGKSLDNRAGVAALLQTARDLYEAGSLPCTVTFLLSDQEELGCRGAKTAAFGLNPDEAVAVDVSFGNSPDVPSHKTGKLGGGAMLGISPVLSPFVTDRLQRLAHEEEIPVQPEVMGGATSTNADVISLTKSGVPCGLLSIPLRNMHTTVEVIQLEDIRSVSRLLTAYARSGGLSNNRRNER